MSDGVELLLHLSKAVAGVLACEIRMRGCGPSTVIALYEVALPPRHYLALLAVQAGSDHSFSVDLLLVNPGVPRMAIWGVPVVEEKPDYAGPVIRGRT